MQNKRLDLFKYLTIMHTKKEQEQEHSQFEVLIQGLINDKYGCCDDFFDTNTISGLRNNIKRLRASEDMKAAGIGNKTEYQKDKLFRGDKIKWIEDKSENEYEAGFVKKIGDFINHLNTTCYTSIKEFESHYAHYEKKSFYKRHLDQFKSDKGRQYSIILYLNEAWQQEDGGVLSLYPEGGAQKDISPLGGRIVFFKSDEMEHEVFPSLTRNRISIAGWLKN